MEESTDPYYLAVIDQDGRAVGTLALMRINPAHRVIEVGSVTYGETSKTHARRHGGTVPSGAIRV